MFSDQLSATRSKLYGFLEPRCVFYDIGAQERLFAISVIAREPTAVAHAFEPAAAVLRSNLSLNGLDVNVHEVAIGNLDCLGDATSITTIDSVVASGLPAPDLIKIDIDGREFDAIAGGENTITAHRPVIITAINDLYFRYHADLRPFLDFMSGAGYVLHALRNETLAPLRLARPVVTLSDLPPSEDQKYW